MRDPLSTHRATHRSTQTDPTGLLFDLFDKLQHFWTLARRLPTEQQFLEGEPVNYCGLLFVLDPEDQTLIHIAVPLDQFDETEIPDMVKEAREIFVDFVRERPSLENLARQRTLLIRVVASYDRFDDEIGPRIRMDRWRDDDYALAPPDGGF